jgi:hypothetical protein
VNVTAIEGPNDLNEKRRGCAVSSTGMCNSVHTLWVELVHFSTFTDGR